MQNLMGKSLEKLSLANRGRGGRRTSRWILRKWIITQGPNSRQYIRMSFGNKCVEHPTLEPENKLFQYIRTGYFTC